MSKMSWKHAVRENMKLTIDREWRLKSSNSTEVNSILRITDLNSEFVFWEVSREFPKYYPFIQKAVHMLGLMFCGKWVRKCQLCQSYISNPTEHLLFYCSQTFDFQETLWRRLIIVAQMLYCRKVFLFCSNTKKMFLSTTFINVIL